MKVAQRNEGGGRKGDSKGGSGGKSSPLRERRSEGSRPGCRLKHRHEKGLMRTKKGSEKKDGGKN